MEKVGSSSVVTGVAMFQLEFSRLTQPTAWYKMGGWKKYINLLAMNVGMFGEKMMQNLVE